MTYSYTAASVAQSQGMSLQDFANQVALADGIPPNLFSGQINQESAWNPNAKNGNATGIAQFMPGTAANFGIDPTNPYQSIQAAGYYDQQLYGQTGSWSNTLNSYGTTANGSAPALAALATQIDQQNVGQNQTTNSRTLIGSSPGLDVYSVGGAAGQGGTTASSNPNQPANGSSTANDTPSPGLVDSSLLGNLKNLLGSSALILIGIVLMIIALLFTDKGKQAVKVVVEKAAVT